MNRRGRDLDQLADLEAERSFLLKSLRDLEAEHEAGDVDGDDYETLRDGYTRRAADVLRQIEAGTAKLAPNRPANWGRRVGIAAGLLAATAGIGWVVADSSGQRLDGDSITGGADDDIPTLLARARYALGGGEYQVAADLYQRVLADPEGANNIEAQTYLAWLLFLGSAGKDGEERDAAIESTVTLLERVVKRAPGYADAHCFLAIVAKNELDDTKRARREGELCLELDPPGDVEGIVIDFLASLDAPTSSEPSSSEPSSSEPDDTTPALGSAPPDT